MLFQPSNILPDVINGLGNGTIAVPEDGYAIKFSWQINGNSVMTAYDIYFYQNDAASTEIGHIGKYSAYASGVDYKGERQRFEAIMPYYKFRSLGITDGNEYKFKIIQYYQENGVEQSVEQRSMSVFRTRTVSDLSITAVEDNVISTRGYTFTGTYFQAQGDGLNWVRWQLYNNTGESDVTTRYDTNLIYDTGQMYGVTNLQFDYDTFLNESTYNLVLTVQTTSEKTRRTSYQFTTSWETTILEGAGNTQAQRVNKQSTAMLVSWRGFRYISGDAQGNVEIVNGVANLGSGSSVTWNTENGNPLAIETPWMMLMKTQLQKADVPQLIELLDTSSNDLLGISYDVDERTLAITGAGMTARTIARVGYDETLSMLVVPPVGSTTTSTLYIRREGTVGALVPFDSSSSSTNQYTAFAKAVSLYGAASSSETSKILDCESLQTNEWISVPLFISTADRPVKFLFNDGASTYIWHNVMYGNRAFMGSDAATVGNYVFRYDGNVFHFIGVSTEDGLFPSETLVPSDEEIPYVVIQSYTLTGFTQSNIGSVNIGGTQNVDYIQIVSGSDNITETSVAELQTSLIDNGTYMPGENTLSGIRFDANFDGESYDAGTFSVSGTNITGWSVYRESKRGNTNIHLIDTDIWVDSIYDYGCGDQSNEYRYHVYPIGDQKYITVGTQSGWVSPCYENWSVIEAEYNSDGEYYKVINEYVFGKNFSSGGISNNNAPAVSNNFTRYATVQMASSNYQSGTLSSLIGHIGYFSYIIQSGDTLDEIAGRFDTTTEQILADNANISLSEELKVGTIIKVFYPQGITAYRDDKKLRDDIWALSTSQNTLFLKSRKGDVMEIRIAGEITMETMDASPLQPITVSLPWVQVGDATNERIIGGIG